ncbi:MAG: tyrosine-type recombinase/integrase [Geovibrio sp.]|nr:tyrosine-type recombinase/integrase [Geovibrio sp.]
MQEHHPQMTIFFALGFYTGMRTGELLALKWSDIDFSKYTITVQRTITKNRIKESTKTEKSRTIDIIPALEAYFKKP